jgi:23S rRNA (cytosine1962-C5)-methyltransferase
MDYRILRIKDKGLKSLQRRHPWIFSGALLPDQQQAEAGEKVWVADADGNIRATGHYGDRSIAVRVLAFVKTAIDEHFYTEKFRNASRLRRLMNLPRSDTDAYRLVHGEGDGLPGLIIDIYANLAVVQSHDEGMANDFPTIASALKRLRLVEHCVHRSAETGVPDGASDEIPDEIGFTENGLRFMANWRYGQKTGFFLDQRENRALLGSMSAGKNVLNAFSYSGGFSLYALRGKATEVHSLDSSEPALEMGERHMELNQMDKSRHRSIQGNALTFLKDANLSHYDIIVLDPPAFAKHRSARHRAVQAYKRLNATAFKKAKPGALIFTFSCSQVVTPELFQNTIAAAAMEAGKPARIVKHLHQPSDHPVSVFHPEGEYLKGLLLALD